MATDNKYDRQLRLWGSLGQKALMEASILLVNAGATGTETLKNLVLPGLALLENSPHACVEQEILRLGTTHATVVSKFSPLRDQDSLQYLL